MADVQLVVGGVRSSDRVKLDLLHMDSETKKTNKKATSRNKTPASLCRRNGRKEEEEVTWPRAAFPLGAAPLGSTLRF